MIGPGGPTPRSRAANASHQLRPSHTFGLAQGCVTRWVRSAQPDGLGHGRLAAYLDGPPRVLDLTEADAVITELEALPTQEKTT